MPQMQWLQAHQEASHYHLQVWLDTQKTVTEKDVTKPDPVYVKSYRFVATPPKGWSGGSLNGTAYTNWEEYVLAETQLLAAADYTALLDAVTDTLAIQGTTFTPA